MKYTGEGYKASSGLQTSVANQEIVPVKPIDHEKLLARANRLINQEDWEKSYEFYKFSFYNDQDCHIIINDNNEQLFLRARQGFNSEPPDMLIKSFKIVENGVTFNWFGAY